MNNPFEHYTPDNLSAQDTVDLFVPVFSEYNNLLSPCNSFINESRGCGKSMTFRFMNPDCQCIYNSKKIDELDYFAITIPIKQVFFNNSKSISDKDSLEDIILIEHEMILYFSHVIFNTIAKCQFNESEKNIQKVKLFYNTWLSKYLKYSGWKGDLPTIDHCETLRSIFQRIEDLFLLIYSNYIKYCHINLIERKLYKDAICTFSDFLLPLIQELKQIDIFPKKPFYLLIDDAGNLGLRQTMILNYWVSLRTTNDICFKVATQHNYKTYKTINGSWIGSPHDYITGNISGIYTSNKALYKKRAKEIIEKRLLKYGFPNTHAEDFFPEDNYQAKRIKEKEFIYKKNYNIDLIHRYLIPDYIRDELKLNRKFFSYSGFDNLVNISSGVIRNFLDFANKMYSQQLHKQPDQCIKYIDPHIQDDEIKKHSEHFLIHNLEKYKLDKSDSSKYLKLENLLNALGHMFHIILISDLYERRVFSVAINDEQDEEIKEILDMGIELGYFQKSIIGNKNGTGYVPLFILNRLLAPFFILDPSNYSGYKVVNSRDLKEAIENPKKFIINVKNKNNKFYSEETFGQLALFENI